MYRSIPVSNKILKKKWDEHLQALHHEKLRTMKSSVDAGKPYTLGIIKGRAKKEQLQEDRYQEIERENRLLLDKMTNIMQGPGHRSSPNFSKKSLNKELRKRDLIKITLENQALLKRLTGKQPSYDTEKWEGERVETEKLLENICEFPYRLGSTRPRGVRELQGKSSLRKTHSGVFKGQHLSPLKRSVFKRGVNISGRYFIVEMTTDKATLTITVSDIDVPDRHVLELPYQEALSLMGGDESYETLLGMFSFDEEGRLTLRDQQRSGSISPFKES